ncbi:TerD family protein [Magnetococcus sp. PR-3]|uniref:TerD family protein n=1 Tax=Magnetococcus sp. PR-3 TaxID=3120355 RepID=UPI002FCDF02F
MSTQLQLDEDFFLTHEGKAVSSFELWYQWERDEEASAQMMDMDISAVMLGMEERMLIDGQMIFFNNQESPCGSIVHMGDDQANESRSAEERMNIRLESIPDDIVQIVFSATIPQEDIPKSHLGMLRRAHFGLVLPGREPIELAHREIHPGGEGEYGWLLGLLYRSEGDWIFRAVRETLPEGMGTLLDHFAVVHGNY